VIYWLLINEARRVQAEGAVLVAVHSTGIGCAVVRAGETADFNGG
jgi:hypothetical protein